MLPPLSFLVLPVPGEESSAGVNLLSSTAQLELKESDPTSVKHFLMMALAVHEREISILTSTFSRDYKMEAVSVLRSPM